jgi:hypothetical protein
MQAFELSQLFQQRADANKLYLEFLNVPNLSMGLYALPRAGPIHSHRTRRMRFTMW